MDENEEEARGDAGTGFDDDHLAPLSYAGAVIEKAIEFLLDKDTDPGLVASALLGGALQLLTQTMTDEGVLRVLENAKASVLAGELRQ